MFSIIGFSTTLPIYLNFKISGKWMSLYVHWIIAALIAISDAY